MVNTETKKDQQLYEKPCKQCGHCCTREVCPFGVLFLDTEKPPCPALIFEEGKYWCGLVRRPADYFPGFMHHYIVPLLLELFKFGVGCDSKNERLIEMGRKVKL